MNKPTVSANPRTAGPAQSLGGVGGSSDVALCRELVAKRDDPATNAKAFYVSALAGLAPALAERLDAAEAELTESKATTTQALMAWTSALDAGSNAESMCVRLRAKVEQLKAAPVIEPGGFVWLTGWDAVPISARFFTRQYLARSMGGQFRTGRVEAFRTSGERWLFAPSGRQATHVDGNEQEAKAAAEKWAEETYGVDSPEPVSEVVTADTLLDVLSSGTGTLRLSRPEACTACGERSQTHGTRCVSCTAQGLTNEA